MSLIHNTKKIGLISALILGLWSNCLFSATVNTAEASPAPKVITSLAPFYEWVSGVMEGVGKPTLLVPIGVSEHDYALKPSQVSDLESADLVVWYGPSLETYLVKKVNQLKPENVMELETLPKIKKLNVRMDELWAGGHHHDHDGDDDHGDDHHHSDDHLLFDPHFWLDPDNAMVSVEAIAEKLSKLDPAHAAQYQKNKIKVQNKIKAMDKAIVEKLKSVKMKPYLVYHDAYHYFEAHYGLKATGSITADPEKPITPQRLELIRTLIKKGDIQCIFTEPQFEIKWIQPLIEGTKDKNGNPIRLGTLDPLGKDPEKGIEGYIELMNAIADSLKECLQ